MNRHFLVILCIGIVEFRLREACIWSAEESNSPSDAKQTLPVVIHIHLRRYGVPFMVLNILDSGFESKSISISLRMIYNVEVHESLVDNFVTLGHLFYSVT